MTIKKIKEDINNNLGNDIMIIHNEGRNKIYEYTGKLVEVYNNVFIVLDNKNSSKRSFSYYDVLTKTVKINFKV
ncbi:MAG: Veg family protein [Bacilli bacterium]|nr:Veg family protein [Bacilli bacterium]